MIKLRITRPDQALERTPKGFASRLAPSRNKFSVFATSPPFTRRGGQGSSLETLEQIILVIEGVGDAELKGPKQAYEKQS